MLPSGEVPTHSGVTLEAGAAKHAQAEPVAHDRLLVRLGSPLPRTWDDPAGWIAAVQSRGFRAAYWPLDDDAEAESIDAYAAAAAAADVVIAEIGA